MNVVLVRKRDKFQFKVYVPALTNLSKYSTDCRSVLKDDETARCIVQVKRLMLYGCCWRHPP